jgi:dihydroorotase
MKPYLSAPSGGPLVQHSLLAMLELYHKGLISLEQIVEKMAHNPAICFNVEKRGFLREGYWADIVLVDLNSKAVVSKDNILSKCGWSPFEGYEFNSRVDHTIVSGKHVFDNGQLFELGAGKRMAFTN